MKKLRIALAALAGASLLAGGFAAATNQEQPKFEKPTINKQVKNVTQGTGYVNADTEADALAANTGDVLIYQVVVTGKLYGLKIEDTLPAGVEEINRVVSDDGKTLTLTVKTTAAGTVQNTACLVRKPKVESPSVEAKPEIAVLKWSQRHPKQKEDICNDAWVQVVGLLPTPTPVASPSPSPAVVAPLTLPSVGAHGGTRP